MPISAKAKLEQMKCKLKSARAKNKVLLSQIKIKTRQLKSANEQIHMLRKENTNMTAFYEESMEDLYRDWLMFTEKK